MHISPYPPPPGFCVSVASKGDKGLCFDTVLQVFILKAVVLRASGQAGAGCLQEGSWGGAEDSWRKGSGKAQRLEGVRRRAGREKNLRRRAARVTARPSMLRIKMRRTKVEGRRGKRKDQWRIVGPSQKQLRVNGRFMGHGITFRYYRQELLCG